HEITDPLGRYLDLQKQGLSGGGPLRRASGEHGHVVVVEIGQTAGRNGGESLTSVRDDDTSVEPRDEPGDLALDVPDRQVRRKQGVTGAERHDLAYVEEGDFPAILEHGRDLGSGSGDWRHGDHVYAGGWEVAREVVVKGRAYSI